MGAQGTLRRDAARNRRQLVEMARIVYAERGLDAPLDEIARRAGVGNATLYRRFPSRGALIAAVFADSLADAVAAGERALQLEDPWTAFAELLTFLCEAQAGNRAFADLLAASADGVPELERLRCRLYTALVALVERAHAAGALRADFEAADVVPVLMANAGLVERTSATAPTAWRRHLGYLLAGLRGPQQALAGPRADLAALERAMHALGERNGLTALPPAEPN